MFLAHMTVLTFGKTVSFAEQIVFCVSTGTCTSGGVPPQIANQHTTPGNCSLLQAHTQTHLVLLLEVIDAPLFVPDGLIPLPDLTLE